MLVDALRARVREEGHSRIAFRCSPYHTGSALYPVIEHLRRFLKWRVEDPPAVKLEKLETMLQGYTMPLGEAVPLFGALLSLEVPGDRYPPLDLSPVQLKQQTQDALIAWTLERPSASRCSRSGRICNGPIPPRSRSWACCSSRRRP